MCTCTTSQLHWQSALRCLPEGAVQHRQVCYKCFTGDFFQHGHEQLVRLAEGSLTRSESGNERLRQEAENSRAEIWRKIQTAKLNNSQKQQVNYLAGSESCTACSYINT